MPSNPVPAVFAIAFVLYGLGTLVSEYRARAACDPCGGQIYVTHDFTWGCRCPEEGTD